jgi:hypothetical protein
LEFRMFLYKERMSNDGGSVENSIVVEMSELNAIT